MNEFKAFANLANLANYIDNGEFPDIIAAPILAYGDASAAGDIIGTDQNIPALSAAGALNLVSSDANDVAGGTGATSVRVFYVDGNQDLAYADVEPAGFPGTEVTASGHGVNSMQVIAAGSGKTNAGSIQVLDGAVATHSVIPAGQAVSRCAKYTIPRNYTMIIKNIFVKSAGSITMTVRWAPFAESGGVDEIIIDSFTLVAGTEQSAPVGVVVEPGHIWVESSTTAVGNRVAIEAYLVRT